VKNSFLALEGAEVMKITPSTRADSDVLAWVFEKNGLYSVRSAYKLLKGDQPAAAMAATNEVVSSGNENAWKAIWKLNVPPKVRVFWWRVLHNSLLLTLLSAPIYIP